MVLPAAPDDAKSPRLIVEELVWFILGASIAALIVGAVLPPSESRYTYATQTYSGDLGLAQDVLVFVAFLLGGFSADAARVAIQEHRRPWPFGPRVRGPGYSRFASVVACLWGVFGYLYFFDPRGTYTTYEVEAPPGMVEVYLPFRLALWLVGSIASSSLVFLGVSVIVWTVRSRRSRAARAGPA